MSAASTPDSKREFHNQSEMATDGWLKMWDNSNTPFHRKEVHR